MSPFSIIIIITVIIIITTTISIITITVSSLELTPVLTYSRVIKFKTYPHNFLSASLYVSKRGAY